MRIETEQKERASGKTWGEYLFDSSVYLGLGYAANAAISVALTHQAQNIPNSWLRKSMESAEGYWRKGIGTLTNDQKQIDYWAPYMNRMLYLSSGGYILLLPTKWLEDNKKAIVEKMDGIFNTGPKTPEQQQAFDEYYDNQPKQSYTSLFAGRLIAHPIIVMAAVPIMLKLHGTDKVGGVLEKFFGESIKNHPHGDKLKQLWSEEIILSGTAAVLTYIFSKSAAALMHKPKEATLPPDLKASEDIQLPPPAEAVAEYKPASTVRSAAVAGVSVLAPEKAIEQEKAETIDQTPLPQVTAAQHLHAVSSPNHAHAHITS